MWYKFELPLRPKTKKNSRPIFKNKKTGKHFLGKSEKLRAYEKEAKKLLIAELEKMGEGFPLTCKVKTRYRFDYVGGLPKVQIADICNLVTMMNDLIQDAGIIENDRQIKVIEHAEVVEGLYDKCTVWIVPLENAKKESGAIGFSEFRKTLKKSSN
jgi:Holliday junction resolvase RusA-like endonuclease